MKKASLKVIGTCLAVLLATSTSFAADNNKDKQGNHSKAHPQIYTQSQQGGTTTQAFNAVTPVATASQAASTPPI